MGSLQCLLFMAFFLGLCILRPAVAQASPVDVLLNTPGQIPPYVRGKGQYSFILSPRALRNGITYESSNERLRVVLDRWRQGGNLTIATIGGSITWGQGCLDAPTYPQYVQYYLEDNHGGRVEVVNGALRAIPSSYMALCHNVRIPRNVDLIIVEYNTNDANYPVPPFVNEPRRAYERLIRKLLSYPNKPAVILLHSYSWQYGDYELGTFWTTAEGEHDTVAHYYQLPTLSVKTACYHLLRLQPPGFMRDVRRAEDFAGLADKAFNYDHHHPNGRTGGRVMAELVIHFMEETLKGLDASPLSPIDNAVVNFPLPPPMIPNNHHSLQDQCFMGHSFTRIITRKEGFEWMNDSQDPRGGKWGMVATTVGSFMELTVDTRSLSNRSSTAAVPAVSGATTAMLVQLAYLQSYNNVGVAEASCVSGCTCQPVKLEGHTTQQFSQLQMVDMLATQHEKCTIRVTVLNETQTGSHKVRVSACIVSEEAGAPAFGLLGLSEST